MTYLHDIRRLIAPAKPTTLIYDGTYFRAQWWRGLGAMEVEILRYTPGVTVVGELQPMSDMNTGWSYVQFAIDMYAANGEGRDWIAPDTIAAP